MVLATPILPSGRLGRKTIGVAWWGGPLVRAGRPRPAAGTTTSASCGAPAGRRGRRPRTRGSAPPIPQDWRWRPVFHEVSRAERPSQQARTLIPLEFDGFDAEALEFLRQMAQGVGAVPKGMACRLLFHAFQHRRYPVGADVGARALAVVR